MGRLKELRKYINSELEKMENTDDIIKEKEQARYDRICEELGLSSKGISRTTGESFLRE